MTARSCLDWGAGRSPLRSRLQLDRMRSLEQLTLDRGAQRVGARTERIAVANRFERGEGVVQSSPGMQPVRSSE